MSSTKPTNRESPPVQEYVIRVTPKANKKYNVMRFSELDSIDFTKWKNVKLDREFNIKEFKASAGEDAPKFGAGSVFGAEQREESRKKRYQKYASRHRPEDQPYILSVKQSKIAQTSNGQPNSNVSASSSKSSRKFRGIREGGITDNTSYYVFFQAHDGAFEAFPVSEWYKFAPIPKFKALTAEEAEEQFTKRDKILNFFTVMNKKKGQNGELNDPLEDGQFAGKRRRKDFKTTDLDDWGDFSDGSANGSGDEDKKSKKKGKKKESDDDDNESEPKEESDEGDFDTREVDYMSDTSSDDEDDEDTAKRLNEELKGVEDEDALRQLVISDEEDEEEEQKPEDDKLKKETDQQASGKTTNDKKPINESSEPTPKIKQEKKLNNIDESDSSDEDFDDNKFQSSIFMQKSEIKKESTNDHQQGTKRKLDTTDSQQQPQQSSSTTKRPRVNGPETNLEETVKRYLMRKPITTTELIKNVRKMKVTNSKDDLVTVISQILKKLDPTKQRIQDKLYLYLNPREQNKNL